MENTSEEAKQRAKNYMSLKGALEPKTMNKTALQWLFEKLPTIDKHEPYYEDIFKKALEMEKQQILNAWQYGMKSDNGHFGTAKEYYEQNFKQLPIEPTEQKPSNHINIGGCF